MTAQPTVDPTQVYRYRDGLYAPDMLITALVWLDLFSWLAEKPSSLEAVCDHFRIHRRPADVMLTLLVAMGFLERRGEEFHATTVAREFLTSGSPWFLGPYYASLKERPVCKDLLQVLRTGKPANWGSQMNIQDWHRAMETEEFATQFTAAMDCRGIFLARAIAQRIDLNGRQRLLDIAGGSGIYACSLVTQFPGLQAAVLEKVPVDRIARDAIARRGMSHRVQVMAGDMKSGELPSGCDVHLFSNVLHDWDEPVVRELLRRSQEALLPGGVIIIHDAHLNEDKSGPLHVAEYSVMLMHSTEGRCYSVAEMREYLGAAGFANVQFTPTVAARSVMTAEKCG